MAVKTPTSPWIAFMWFHSSWIFCSMVLTKKHQCDFLLFWVSDLYWIFFFFINMGPCGCENFKTLLLLQIETKNPQASPEFSFQWSSQKYLFRFLTTFFSIFLHMHPCWSKNVKILLFLQIAFKWFKTSLKCFLTDDDVPSSKTLSDSVERAHRFPPKSYTSRTCITFWWETSFVNSESPWTSCSPSVARGRDGE